MSLKQGKTLPHEGTESVRTPSALGRRWSRPKAHPCKAGKGSEDNMWPFSTLFDRIINHLIKLEIFPKFIRYIFKFFKLIRLVNRVLFMLL